MVNYIKQRYFAVQMGPKALEKLVERTKTATKVTLYGFVSMDCPWIFDMSIPTGDAPYGKNWTPRSQNSSKQNTYRNKIDQA